MEKEVLMGLVDYKKLAILKTLYFSKEELYLRELAKKSKVSVSSVFRILQELQKIGLVKIREIKMMKFYDLVRNEKILFLDNWFGPEGLLRTFTEKIKKLSGVAKAFIYGKIKDGRGNVIILGSNINQKEVDNICEEIKILGLDLDNVIFDEKQYSKLEKMGVYGGEKKVLF